MNKKGQALVEFVLVLPILIFIIFAFIDVSRLMIMKNHLETVLNEIDSETSEVKDKEYEITMSKKDTSDGIEINLKSCLEVMTPGFDKILGDPACVTTSKTITNEKE